MRHMEQLIESSGRHKGRLYKAALLASAIAFSPAAVAHAQVADPDRSAVPADGG